MTRKVLLEVALNGSTTPDVNPTVPRRPEDIAAQALEVAALGASILHSHPEATMADYTKDLAAYRAAWAPVMAVHPDAIFYPTARLGPAGTPHQALWEHNEILGREGLAAMSLVDPGSVNLGMRPDGSLHPQLADRPYVNSHAATEYRLRQSAALGLGPSVSIFDPSFLRSIRGFHQRGLVPRGTLLKIYFSEDETFGFRPTPCALTAYLELMEGLTLPWAVAVLGGDILESDLPERVMAAGGHLRVGLEDHTRAGRHSNADLTRAAIARIRAFGAEPAGFADTRRLLGLPPGGRT